MIVRCSRESTAILSSTAPTITRIGTSERECSVRVAHMGGAHRPSATATEPFESRLTFVPVLVHSPSGSIRSCQRAAIRHHRRALRAQIRATQAPGPHARFSSMRRALLRHLRSCAPKPVVRARLAELLASVEAQIQALSLTAPAAEQRRLRRS
jgi:hypothetical protein